MIDNAIDCNANITGNQELSEKISTGKLQCELDEFAWQFGPVKKEFNLSSMGSNASWA